MGVLRRGYDALMAAARGPRAVPALMAVAFAESSFFPIPPDVMLIPMMLARPDRIWRLAAICTAASVVGGLLGYAIGALLFDTIGAWLIRAYGLGADFAAFQKAFADWGFWIIVGKGMTPIPYKLVTIASGLAHFNLALFVTASIISRAVRFFLVGVLIRLFGPTIQVFIERYLGWVTTGVLVLIALGFYLLKFA